MRDMFLDLPKHSASKKHSRSLWKWTHKQPDWTCWKAFFLTELSSANLNSDNYTFSEADEEMPDLLDATRHTREARRSLNGCTWHLCVRRPSQKQACTPQSQGDHEGTQLSEATIVRILNESLPILYCKLNNRFGKCFQGTRSKLTLARLSLFYRILPEDGRDVYERIQMSTKCFVGITGDKIDV